LAFIVDSGANYSEDFPVYRPDCIPDDVEAIIFPARWKFDADFLQMLSNKFPEKLIGQINLVALNPFDRKKITAYRQSDAVASDVAKEKPVSDCTSSYWDACVKFIKKICYAK